MITLTKSDYKNLANQINHKLDLLNTDTWQQMDIETYCKNGFISIDLSISLFAPNDKMQNEMIIDNVYCFTANNTETKSNFDVSKLENLIKW